MFFYANAYGSRVFFDEMGPPWPKHPCTAADSPINLSTDRRPVAPVLHTWDAGSAFLGALRSHPAFRPEREFREFYGVLAPTPWVVVGGLVGGEASAVHLQRAFLPGSLLTLWGWGSWFLPVGWTVFYDGATLNWFDLATLAAHERPVRQVLDNAQWRDHGRWLA